MTSELSERSDPESLRPSPGEVLAKILVRLVALPIVLLGVILWASIIALGFLLYGMISALRVLGSGLFRVHSDQPVPGHDALSRADR